MNADPIPARHVLTPPVVGVSRRRWAWALLDMLDDLAMLPAIRWLRALRIGVYLAAVGAFVSSDRSGAVLLLLTAIALEVALFRLVLVEMLRREAGR